MNPKGTRLRRLIRGLRDFVDDLAGTSPARLAIGAFCLVVLVFVVLLSLPVSYEDPEERSLPNAVFVAVSAVSVTGLTPVETQDYWSDFGVGVIILGIQVGGLGILTLASLLGMAMSKRLGVRQRMIAAQATGTSSLGRVGTLLRAVFITVLSVEAVIVLLLLPRFLMRGESWPDALWHAVFYAISSFNNAGFTIHPGGMEHFADDPWILLVIAASVFVGSLGFPVIFIIAVYWNRPRRWDLHTKLTLTTSAILVLAAFVLQLVFEAGNPRTLGGKDWAQTGLEALFMAIMPRSGGFATMEMAEMTQASHLVFDVLMFIGGGSSSTAGGIKVTTLAVLVLAAVAEARGTTDATAFGRRIAPTSVRLAVSVLLAGASVVFVGTIVMLTLTEHPLDLVLFEVISAFATCGLTSGVTAEAPDSALYVLSVLMLVGRLGTITLATALSRYSRTRLYRYPEERPIVG
ncbi:TrkH family potassium uptake protein [Brevibacterium album]|uniref:TrkH family potassium uptake protein n=1 Tax=Brevibacterium album TaxID=417948 RepID=UPI001FDFDB47|nr:potassium transporter TrkG [Brevibacterium album]